MIQTVGANIGACSGQFEVSESCFFIEWAITAAHVHTIIWQCEVYHSEPDGQNCGSRWVDYAPNYNIVLEAAHQAGAPDVKLSGPEELPGGDWDCDFGRCRQTNTRTKVQRRIRTSPHLRTAFGSSGGLHNGVQTTACIEGAAMTATWSEPDSDEEYNLMPYPKTCDGFAIHWQCDLRLVDSNRRKLKDWWVDCY